MNIAVLTMVIIINKAIFILANASKIIKVS